MALNLSILYRGPLSSCNYDCSYCPFAKRRESADELEIDRAALGRFVAWVAARPPDDRFGILFTPWGEALVRRWYQAGLSELTSLPNVSKAAIQTNLSAGLDWTERCDLKKLALWATYHPTQISRDRFLKRCRELRERNVAHSVGVVGKREHFAEIEALRRELPAEIYLWINAYKDEPNYYAPAEIDWLTAIDAHFPANNRRHPSFGRECDTGRTSVSVDGSGNVRRCHFVKGILGNLYDPDFEGLLRGRPCPNETCGCHIGYVHMPELRQAAVYGPRILERIPLAYVSTSGS